MATSKKTKKVTKKESETKQNVGNMSVEDITELIKTGNADEIVDKIVEEEEIVSEAEPIREEKKEPDVSEQAIAPVYHEPIDDIPENAIDFQEETTVSEESAANTSKQQANTVPQKTDEKVKTNQTVYGYDHFGIIYGY